jgi:hypothetical protein
MNVMRRIAMLYFIIVVVLLLSHLHCVIDYVTCTIGFHGGHFFSKTEMDPQCRVIGQHHCVSCDFIVIQAQAMSVLHVHFRTQ